MTRPRLLDLFCCQGGASAGYAQAGFDVTGVDIDPQPRYPYRFIQADAVQYARDHAHEYDAVHASPPCQHATAGTRAMRARGDNRHPALIEPTRQALQESGRPWVIENVAGAALRDPMLLCGTMFRLGTVDDDGTPLELRRHRLFESNLLIVPPGKCAHGGVAKQVAGAYGGARRDKVEARTIRRGGYVPPKPVLDRLLGIDWMNEHGLFQSLPPTYTEWIGRQLAQHVQQAAA